MNKQVLRLTEQDLNSIVEESVRRIIQENMEDEGLWGKFKGGVKGIGNSLKGEYNKLKNGVMNTGINNEYEGQSFKDRFNSAKDHIKQSANVGDRAQEHRNFLKQLDVYIKQGILSKDGTKAAKILKKSINSSLSGDKGRLTQNYKKNGYK